MTKNTSTIHFDSGAICKIEPMGGITYSGGRYSRISISPWARRRYVLILEYKGRVAGRMTVEIHKRLDILPVEIDVYELAFDSPTPGSDCSPVTAHFTVEKGDGRLEWAMAAHETLNRLSSWLLDDFDVPKWGSGVKYLTVAELLDRSLNEEWVQANRDEVRDRLGDLCAAIGMIWDRADGTDWRASKKPVRYGTPNRRSMTYKLRKVAGFSYP